MSTQEFPKLKTPIETKGLSDKDRAILLAYFILRPTVMNELPHGLKDTLTYAQDMHAVLITLGQIIEHDIPGGKNFFTQ